MKTLILFLLLCTQSSWSHVVSHPDFETAPRPSLIPESIISLENDWEFGIGESQQGQKIHFGFAPESDLSGVNYETMRPSGTQDKIWYQTEVDLPVDWQGAILTFEGVDYESKVFINDEFAFSHLGAYAPFDINISPFLRPGKNKITLKVTDDRARRDIAAGKQERRPKEGVIFYGNSSGAWKGAHLRKMNPRAFIKDFKVKATSNGKVNYVVLNEGHADALRFQLIDRGSKRVVFSETKKITSIFHSGFYASGASAWSPDSPTLYDVKLELLSGDKVVETLRSYLGFSDFAQRSGNFELNGRPFYLRGILNQMVYPKGLYTPESMADQELDLKALRSHGFNFQRVHNTTPRWRDIYRMENGVLVNGKKWGVAWSLEMPSARDLRNPAALAQFLKEWQEIIWAYGYQPGLLYYVPGNEDWGMLEDPDHNSPASDEQRAAFQTKLIQATLEATPRGSLVSPSDGWRQITGVKNGSGTGIPASQIILSGHDYRGSGVDLRNTYGPIPAHPPVGYMMPRNGKDLIMPGYDFPGDAVAFMLGEFGGKSFAPPEAGDVFGYGQVYRDISLWERDALEQLAVMSTLDVLRGGYVYTQLRDAGNKPQHPPKPGEPGGELNGILFADGKVKGHPELWNQINLKNEKQFSKK